jgi:hypothetical protein
MPKLKLMIKSSSVEIAKAKRTCVFSRDEIAKGDQCLVLFEDARDRYVYSKDVALKMVEVARQRLDDIETALKNGDALE